MNLRVVQVIEAVVNVRSTDVRDIQRRMRPDAAMTVVDGEEIVDVLRGHTTRHGRIGNIGPQAGLRAVVQVKAGLAEAAQGRATAQRVVIERSARVSTKRCASMCTERADIWTNVANRRAGERADAAAIERIQSGSAEPISTDAHVPTSAPTTMSAPAPASETPKKGMYIASRPATRPAAPP